MENIIGISGDCGHNSAVALFQNGILKYAEAEERLSRIKRDGNFPSKTLQVALDHLISDQIIFAVTGLPQEASNKADNVEEIKFHNASIKIAREINAHIHHVEHHLAHARCAQYYADFDNGIIITADGQGDGVSTALWELKENQLEQLWYSKISDGSLGYYFAAITEFLGYKRMSGEGKVTALACHGKRNPELEKLFYEIIEVQKDVHQSIRLLMNKKYINNWNNKEKLFKKSLSKLLEPFTKEDIAYAAQKHLEKVVLKLLDYFIGYKKSIQLAVSGGVFSNVLLNARISMDSRVNNLVVTPPMGDEGLAIGSAIEVHIKKHINFAKNKSLFLGSDAMKKPLELSLRNHKEYEVFSGSKEKIIELSSSLLSKGEVLVRCFGRSEFGPRALGNRSLLYQSNDVKCQEWLNEKLNRDPVMPFCPIVRYEDLSKVTSMMANRYKELENMTIAVPVTEFFSRKCPAVVHGNTARIQSISFKTNPQLWSILNSYTKLTGLPALINTSLNMHHEPICNDIEDALTLMSKTEINFAIVDANTIVFKRPKEHLLLT